MSELRPPRYLKPMNRIVKAIAEVGHPDRAGDGLDRARQEDRPAPQHSDDAVHLPRRPVHRRGVSRRGLGGQCPGGGRRHPLPRTQVAQDQDRRTRRGGVTTGAARVPGSSSGRCRVREALGAGAAKELRTSSRRSQADWSCSGSTRRARTHLGRRALHDNVAGAGAHVHDEGFVALGRAVRRLQGVAHVRPNRCADRAGPRCLRRYRPRPRRCWSAPRPRR